MRFEDKAVTKKIHSFLKDMSICREKKWRLLTTLTAKLLKKSINILSIGNRTNMAYNDKGNREFRQSNIST
jgi:hypothetical protein